MSNRVVVAGLLTLLLVLAGCGPTPPPTAVPPTEQPHPEGPTEAPPVPQEAILISELLPGIAGVNNNLEYVELYNAGIEAVDLDGWSLWYRLHDAKEEELVYAWTDRADIPGYGHYLLTRTGQAVGNIGDATFDLALFEKKGGLALRDTRGATVDTLVWGGGPSDFRNGSPATPPEGGASLERMPGGAAGNGRRTGDDAADFALNPNPSPQNSGDAPTPLPTRRLALTLSLPQSVDPGSEVALDVEIRNLTGGPVHEVRLLLPLPTGFDILSLPAGGAASEGWVQWTLAEVADGVSATGTIRLQAPWTYMATLLRGTYAEAADWTQRAYGPVLPLSVEGGAIPIATARTLKGKTVTVEGVATMYTDGFYAGSTGTKFYMEDETGGIQVYCPEGKGLVQVQAGDRVRVTGLIELYRDSMEIVPATYPDDVELLEQGGPQPEPVAVDLQAATSDGSLQGRLIAVEGTATRIDEFSFSYEVDLMDDEGHILLVYVSKDAGLTAEYLDFGSLYRVTGISELYDGQWEIMPRFQSDLVEIFPPELMLEMEARLSALPGETISYTLIAYNHTDAALTGVRIVAVPPAEGVAVADLLDGGQPEGNAIVWILPELAGGGAAATVRYTVVVGQDASGQIVAEGAVASADQWPDPVVTNPHVTFVGSGVPIWAIQGSGMVSPYVRNPATTVGVVTGVFPELHGFWIQEEETDADPTTSGGLFVAAESIEVPLEIGDRVTVSGKVRERSGQTMLEILRPDDLTVVSQGNELPPAVELDPPIDNDEALIYKEALEGMLVQVTEPAVAVGPTTKYGETALVRAVWQIERVLHGDPTGMLIFVDDGSEMTHLDQTTLPFALQTGDTVVDLVGPLAYTYDNYKIEPIAMPTITSTKRPAPKLGLVGPDQFSIATFNAENLFDPSDPHPSDPPIPSTRQYKLDLAKTADAILAMGAPTIVGLQEVENIEILADLAREEAIAPFDYEPVLHEGTDSRGIDVGYLVRGDRATLEGAASYPAPEGLTSRPPLLITTTLHLDSGEARVYVLNNHSTSMSGGEAPTEPRRVAQAAWNVTLVQKILGRDPEAYVVVLGDLNSFYESTPLDVLRQGGLRHVYEFVEPERPYSYIYEGESETLDHILLTPSLYGLLTQVEAVHINADYPLPLPDDTTARGTSDHDPIVAAFSLR